MPRHVALFLACVFLILAFIGILLPGVPTVPFLLLAAWCAAKGSPRMHRWLYAQPYLGQLLSDWHKQQAISRQSKIIALLMLLMSWGLMFSMLSNEWVRVVVSLLFVAVATYLISRRERD